MRKIHLTKNEFISIFLTRLVFKTSLSTCSLWNYNKQSFIFGSTYVQYLLGVEINHKKKYYNIHINIIYHNIIGGEAFWNQSVLNFPTVNTAHFEPPERRNIRDCRDKTGTQFLDCDYQVVVCQNSL